LRRLWEYGGTKAQAEDLPRNDTEKHGIKTHTSFRAGDTHPLGAKSKGSNGVVAVGLPHRNYSVLKQAHINQREVKVVKVRNPGEHQRIDIRRSIKKGGLRVVNKSGEK